MFYWTVLIAVWQAIKVEQKINCGKNMTISMSRAVQELVQHFSALWWECESGTPQLGRTFTAREQSVRKDRLERFVDEALAEMKRLPRTRTEREAARKRIGSSFERFARSALDWEDRHLDVFLSRGFDRAAIEFAQRARRFDPAVSVGDIIQAGRNAWVMNGLQVLLGQPIQLTPAIFAYSMLYPYSDNYLDDPTISAETKLAFNERFRQRIEGQDITPANTREKIIFDLVAMIEGQFERSCYPQVFESLLAIHRAQAKSVRLLCRHASPYEVDVLGISLEKGGTSVLADGYLVAGFLTPAQAEFAFGFGAFLQFGDDQEDVLQDKQDGLLTLFSQTAGRWPLDTLTNRTLHFGARVLEGLDGFGAPGSEPLKELIRRGAVQALVGSAGSTGRLYSRSYLEQLEAHSPFRFSFINKQRQKLFRQRGAWMRLFESLVTPDGGVG
jgi:hypothetical protein